MTISGLMRMLLASTTLITAYSLFANGSFAGFTNGSPFGGMDIGTLEQPSDGEDVSAVFYVASTHTLQETSWDGAGHLSGLASGVFVPLPFVSPPDLMMCMKPMGSGSKTWCSAANPKDGRHAQVTCHNSLTCDWYYPGDLGVPLMLAVLDHDDGLFEGPWDLADVAVVLPRGVDYLSASDTYETKEVVLDWLQKLSPTGLQGERLAWASNEAKRRHSAIQFISQQASAEWPMTHGTMTLYHTE